MQNIPIDTPTSSSKIDGCDPIHQNNGLIFQFIFSELLEAFEHFQYLDHLCDQITVPFANYVTLEHHDDKRISCLKMTLEKLIGENKKNHQLITWRDKDPTLTKLKKYCALFIKNLDIHEKQTISLEQISEKICQSCQKTLDIFYKNPISLLEIIDPIKKIKGLLVDFTKLMMQMLPKFRDNENVIFFLLQHSEQFDKVFGLDFMAKQITALYPRGLKEAHFILIKRYTERGFEHLLPLMTSKFADMEKTS